MSLAYQKLPNDPFFEEMDPLMYLWLFENWDANRNRKQEELRSIGILIGSFYNPEAAEKMLDSANTISTSDEDFDKLVDSIIGKPGINERLSRRKRKIIAKAK
jgi:hypothetical protein